MQTSLEVLGGLKITIEFDAVPAEPEVGIAQSYVEDWEICAIAGRKIGKSESCRWIYDKLTKLDRERIDDAIYEALTDIVDDDGFGY